ncbi:MAG TPA: copper oxidase [Thermoanaerobaculia bacterium]|nr:copper oxidase [Thermoanaerobaculia bacterium]
MISRRGMLFSSVAGFFGAAALRAGRAEAAPTAAPTLARARRVRGRTPVITPNGTTLPFRMENGVKAFHLIAEPVKREFAPGFVVDCWGYNGATPGPTIEAIEGERVRIYVTNNLPEATSIHWHGMIVPNGMDGVTGLTQPKIDPGETFAYEFTLKQSGTLMYHPHYDEMTQMAQGMQGFFIIHPRDAGVRAVDRDFALFLGEWLIKPGTSRPDPAEMLDFNVYTFNSRVFPGTAALPVLLGDRVRIRLANLSMDSHPIHIHGHRFFATGTEAGPIPETAWIPESTISVPVGTTRDIEFVADNPGDWPFHCHKTHHAMNQMAHGLPNLLGVDTSGIDERVSRLVPGAMIMGPTGMGSMSEMNMGAPPNTASTSGPGPFGTIDMGGMFTIIKVRESLAGHGDPGWYEHPRGTVAWKVDSVPAGGGGR